MRVKYWIVLRGGKQFTNLGPYYSKSQAEQDCIKERRRSGKLYSVEKENTEPQLKAY